MSQADADADAGVNVCFAAICDHLLIQQNIGGYGPHFNRTWEEFKHGFGNQNDDYYWIGNELLHRITNRNHYKVRFELQARRPPISGQWFWAEYTQFRVLSEAKKYKLLVSGFSGNVSYDAFFWCNNVPFTTYDNENDFWNRGNCASRTGGGFWFGGCYQVGVNSARDTGCFRWYTMYKRKWDKTVMAVAAWEHDLQATRMWLECQ